MSVNPIVNRPDQHGFIMAGTETIYICHLPMFNMEDHMYQITLEVTIPKDIHEAYMLDKKSHPDTFYVLGNVQTDLFTLPSVMLGEKKSFTADIFRGMPQDPNKDTPLFHNVETIISRVVYARHFDYSIPYPEPLTYIVFGNEKEAFMDHYLTKERDFMDLVQLNEVPKWLPIEQLAISANVGFEGHKSLPIPSTPPVENGNFIVTFQGQPYQYPLEVGKSFYFDTEIVNMPAHEEATTH